MKIAPAYVKIYPRQLSNNIKILVSIKFKLKPEDQVKFLLALLIASNIWDKLNIIIGEY
jgi:hypothetical protein